MGDYHNVKNIRIERGVLHLEVDGQTIQASLQGLSPRLGNAAASDLAQFEVSPSGYGIHWPLLDEDISIDGLLGISHAPVEWKKVA
ncbi:MAG: DUF2442 domain-containing protein [Betaproteobacteria bacterium]|nr:DUF2442 domain-containing protein [Betaproteobacteria bacterium]